MVKLFCKSIPVADFVLVVAPLIFLLVCSPHKTMAAPIDQTDDVTFSTPDTPVSLRERRHLASTSSAGGDSQMSWTNPCNIGEDITPFEGTPSPDQLRDLITSLLKVTNVNIKRTTTAKQLFLNATYKDPEFEDSVQHFHQSWLPEVPVIDTEKFKTITIQSAYKDVFTILQHYAVGIEQAVLDQMLYAGPFSRLFEQVQVELSQLLCEMQVGIILLNVKRDPDVLRDVMSHQYRVIENARERTMRDYLILRDYLKVLEYIQALFEYLKEHPNFDALNTGNQ